VARSDLLCERVTPSEGTLVTVLRSDPTRPKEWAVAVGGGLGPGSFVLRSDLRWRLVARTLARSSSLRLDQSHESPRVSSLVRALGPGSSFARTRVPSFRRSRHARLVSPIGASLAVLARVRLRSDQSRSFVLRSDRRSRSPEGPIARDSFRARTRLVRPLLGRSLPLGVRSDATRWLGPPWRLRSDPEFFPLAVLARYR
jgi:hypothetical protein